MITSIAEFIGPSSSDTDGSISPAKAVEHNKNPVIIFGNSLRAYEERTVSSSRERKDDTNGVFVAASFATEIPVSVVNTVGKMRDRGCDMIMNEALRHSETAFSDCNVIYFHVGAMTERDDPNNDDNNNNKNDAGERRTRTKAWPERPREWFISADSDYGGELQ